MTLTLTLSRREREFPPDKYQNIFCSMTVSYRVPGILLTTTKIIFEALPSPLGEG